ncbi:MAG: hypothetical protein Q8Q58_07815 [Candidatus Rokubacteria bacterium]|nr:hypothetical protein [Candidatus Rokubacteria bacterium]
MRRTIHPTLTALVLVVLIPPLAGDELVGVLTLDLEPGHVVDARALLVPFASQAAVALRTARLFTRMRCCEPCGS